MRIVFRHRNADRVFRVDGALEASLPLITIVEPMLAQSGLAAPTTVAPLVRVDGRATPLAAIIAEAVVVDGSVIELNPAPPQRVATSATIDVTGGLDSGRRFPLVDRRLVAGRAADADITLSSSTADPYHLAIDRSGDGVQLTDLHSTNGTLIDGAWLVTPTAVPSSATVDVGTAQLTVRAGVDDHPDVLLTLRGRTAAGHLPFNRPPRPVPEAAATTISVPAEDTASSFATLFSWAGLLGPLALGGLMAWLYNPLWALFALLGPVMMVGSWLESRRRNSKANRRRHRSLDAELERLRVQLEVVVSSELTRRQARCPDPAELLRRVWQPSTALWQRRNHHDDALEVTLGTADLEWTLEPLADGRPEPTAVAIVAEHVHLDNSPLIVDASAGEVIGLAGPREATLAIARSLVLQASVHHGPADVELMVLTDDEAAPHWQWTSWLPHTRSRASRGRSRAIANGASAIAELVEAFLDTAAPKNPDRHATDGAVLLCVVDGDGLTTGRAAPARAILGGHAGPAAGIVIASSRDRLPQRCTTVIEVTDSDGIGRVATPAAGRIVDEVLFTGVAIDVATDTARRLARYADPEVDLTEASIPSDVSLLHLLDLPGPSSEAIIDRWRQNRDLGTLAAPIGADGLGTLTVDLVADGPHALIGGTTGSGKSELLRSLVAGLAAGHSPEELNFVLIDYKGGSAFDRCAALPHTVGLVTDLDEHLGARALRCLDAELHHRERILRAAGATDIAAYIETAPSHALPRLVVVIDEFATMAAELPDFLDALVGIAQRGRSLGVHLVLATQRPSGAVSPAIRTNTNLRVALRVLDAADSADVIDRPDAASIPRDQPGRACVRLGPSEVVPFQSALVTGHTPAGRGDSVRVVLDSDQGSHVDTVADGPSDLDRLVDAIGRAHHDSAGRTPRRPWPEPLPDQVVLSELSQPADDEAALALGLADLPDEQRQATESWCPSLGNALLVGMPGSGTTTALGTIVCSIAARYSSDAAHVYCIDHGAGGLRALEALPHVGSVVDPTDDQRQLRLLRQIDDERRRRTALPAGALANEPMVVLVIDGYGSWRDEMDAARHHDEVERFARIYADGPAVGVYCLLATDHVGSVGRALLATTAQVWMFRLADPSDYLVLGTRVEATVMPPGRAFTAADGREVQFALAHPHGIEAAVAELVAHNNQPGALAPTIGELPVETTVKELAAVPRVEAMAPIWIPVGIGDDHLATVGFELYPGEHALVGGRARTGKTSALRAVAQVLAGSAAHVVALAPNRSALLTEPSLAFATTGEAEAVASLASCRERLCILLVDDADTFADAAGALAALLDGDGDGDGSPAVHVIAAGRTDRLLSAYGHWTGGIRTSRVGVVLCPEVLDGDLFGSQLPARAAQAALPGRGWIFGPSGRQVCQLARPDQSVAVPPDPMVERDSATNTDPFPHRATQRSRATRSA